MAEKTKKNPPTSTTALLGRAVWVCAILVALGGVILAEGQAVGFLMRDPRFFLERAKEYGDPPPNLQIDGLRYTDRDSVLRVFEEDLGRSVYLLPLHQRRLQLLGIPWVADATVSRLWPDRVSVRIVERYPIAFVKQKGASDALLIDAEGFLMNAPLSATFQLPVVAGVGPDIPEPTRVDRMRRVERLIRELGPKISGISEIDAWDVNNLLIIQPLHGRAVTLKMGSKNFGVRYENFLALADDLLERLPNGVIFDLRLPEQVVVGEDASVLAPAAAPPAASTTEKKRKPRGR